MTASGDCSVEDRRPTARCRFSMQLAAVPSTSWRLQHDSVPKATVSNFQSSQRLERYCTVVRLRLQCVQRLKWAWWEKRSRTLGPWGGCFAVESSGVTGRAIRWSVEGHLVILFCVRKR